MISIEKRVSQLVAKGMAMLLVAEFVIGVVHTFRVQPATEDPIIPEEPAAARPSPSEFCEIHVVPLGYKCEEYKVQTDDGFILVLHRLSNEGRQALPPAILHVSPQAVSSGDQKFNGQSQQTTRNNLQSSINRRLFQLQSDSLTVAGTSVLDKSIKDHQHRGASNPRSSKGYKHYTHNMRTTLADPNSIVLNSPGSSPATPANSPTLRFSLVASTPSFEKFSPRGCSGKATPAPYPVLSSPTTSSVPVREDTPGGSSEVSIVSESTAWSPAPTLSPRSPRSSDLLTPQSSSFGSAPLPNAPESYFLLSSAANSPVSLRGYTTGCPPEVSTASSSAWSPATILSPHAPGPSDFVTPQSTSFAPLSTPPYSSPLGSTNTGNLRIPFSPGPEPSMADFCNSEQPVIPSPSRSDRNESDIRKHHLKAPGHCRPVPVLLMHPEFLNGGNWFFRNSPTDQLLPLMLTDAGYDVWVGHQRATLWGHDHASLKPNDSRYWEWTWDEHAQYDIPALLSVIKNETGNHANHSIHYIGVSQSATAGAAAATNQSVARLLKSMTLIGPTIYRGNTDSLVLSAWSSIADEIFYRQGYNGGVFNYSRFHFPVNTILGKGPMSIALATITGPNCCLGSIILDSDNGWDGTTSVKNLIHFEQGVRTNTWQHFMYETDEDNIHAYEGVFPWPPSYNPGDIPARLPIFVVYGEQDMVSPRDGVREFLSLLKRQPESLNLPQYAHFDLIYSVNRTEAVYTPILQFLERW